MGGMLGAHRPLPMRCQVWPGSLLYVSATTEHSFFQIEEDMTLLVIFASASQ